METGRPTWRSRAWVVASTVLVLLLLALVASGFDSPASAWAALALSGTITLVVLGWALLHTRTQRRRYEDELATWAAERATHTERLRIAGDLHDLVSHGLGLITVRAAVARRMPEPDGGTERVDALGDIERVSRETTTELRRMLAVLRDPGAAPLRPADTLDDLPAIVEEASAAGLAASLAVEELGEVSPGVQLTVCAIVREALNNTIRHAGPSPARVGVQRDGEAIVVDVQDDGPGGPWQRQPGAGHGLDGLRARVAALGGTLQVGPAERGFRLVARIPDGGRS